jgi:hypothetical protein
VIAVWQLDGSALMVSFVILRHMADTSPPRILFTLRANQTIPRELWDQFTARIRENGQRLGPVLRALIMSYLEKGLGDATKHYQGE